MKETNHSPKKLFYKIGEVAEMFNTNVSLIRFWEKEFDILKPKKNKKGNRLFTKKVFMNRQQIISTKSYICSVQTNPQRYHNSFVIFQIYYGHYFYRRSQS